MNIIEAKCFLEISLLICIYKLFLSKKVNVKDLLNIKEMEGKEAEIYFLF